MTRKRGRFRWSDVQIVRATGRRALPIYTAEDVKVREDLMNEGMNSVNARRRGGRTRRAPMHIIRRILIEDAVYPKLEERLRKFPSGRNTVANIIKGLAALDVHAGEATIRSDLKIIGTKKLRSR